MLSRRVLLDRGLGRVRFAGARWQSTNKPFAPVAPVAPVPVAPPIPQTPIPQLSTEPEAKKPSNASSTIALILSSFILGAGLASVLPLSEIAKFTAMEHLPEPGTPEEAVFKADLENKLSHLKLYKKLSADPQYESRRAWSYIDSNTKNASLSAGTLSVPGGFAIRPVIFVNKEKQEMVAIVHLGQKLCGYPFVVHGGILASILDEVLKRGSCFKFGIDPLNGYTPKQIKTNLIELQYRFPTLANRFVVVKTSINEKGQVIGDIETLKGRLLVKGLGEFEKRGGSVLPTAAPTPRKKWFGIF